MYEFTMKYAEICSKYARNMQKCTGMKYAKIIASNMQVICKKYASSLHKNSNNMQEYV